MAASASLLNFRYSPNAPGIAGRSAPIEEIITKRRTPVRAAALAARIAASRLQQAVAESTRLRDAIIRYNEAVLLQVQQTAACNALHRIEGRLARWLLHTRDRTDSDEVPLTQEFLSQMLGVQRTTVNLALRTLQGAGLIRPRRGRVEILDRGKLEQMACECYGIIRDQIAQVLPEAQH